MSISAMYDEQRHLHDISKVYITVLAIKYDTFNSLSLPACNARPDSVMHASSTKLSAEMDNISANCSEKPRADGLTMKQNVCLLKYPVWHQRKGP